MVSSKMATPLTSTTIYKQPKKRLTPTRQQIVTSGHNAPRKTTRSVFSISPQTPVAVDITEQSPYKTDKTPTKQRNSNNNNWVGKSWTNRQPNPAEFQIPHMFDDEMITMDDNLPAVGDENGAYLHLLKTMEKGMNATNPMRLPLNTLVKQYKTFCRTLLQIMANNPNIEWITREKQWANTMGYILWSGFPLNHWENWPGYAVTQTSDATSASNLLKEKGPLVIKWYENCKEADTIITKIIKTSLEFCYSQKNKLSNLAYLPQGPYDASSVTSLTNGHKLWKALDDAYRELFFTEFNDLLPSVDTMNALTLQGFRLTTKDLKLLPVPETLTTKNARASTFGL